MWFLLIHGIFTIWVLNNGLKRKVNIIPWVIATIILGPIIIPEYLYQYPLKSGDYKKNNRVLNTFKILAFFWALLLVITGLWSRQNTLNTIKNETLEYKLAVLNTRDSNCRDEVTIKRFGVLLDQLANICTENRQQIANLSLIAHHRLKRNGDNESLLRIMSDLNELCMAKNLRKQKFSEYVLAYIGLRNGGLSHKETIEKLQCIEKGY